MKVMEGAPLYVLIDRNGCIGFESDEKPDVPADGGTKEDPYTVDQVLTLGNPGTTAWVKGYIVGSAADDTADSFTTTVHRECRLPVRLSCTGSQT